MNNLIKPIVQDQTAQLSNKAPDSALNLLPRNTTNNTLGVLEKIIAKTCTCKLRTFCLDKNSENCLKHQNIVAQAMLARYK